MLGLTITRTIAQREILLMNFEPRDSETTARHAILDSNVFQT